MYPCLTGEYLSTCMYLYMRVTITSYVRRSAGDVPWSVRLLLLLLKYSSNDIPISRVDRCAPMLNPLVHFAIRTRHRLGRPFDLAFLQSLSHTHTYRFMDTFYTHTYIYTNGQVLRQQRTDKERERESR